MENFFMQFYPIIIFGGAFVLYALIPLIMWRKNYNNVQKRYWGKNRTWLVDNMTVNTIILGLGLLMAVLSVVQK